MNNLANNRIRVMLVGPYPPPFGGISSLIVSLLEGFQAEHVDKAVVVYFDNKNSIEIMDRAIIYRLSVKKHAIRKILSPKNWLLLPKFILTYRSKGLSLLDHIKNFIQISLLLEVAKKERINVASFFQSDYSVPLLFLKKWWKDKVGIALTVFGEIYDLNQYMMQRKKLFLEMIVSSDIVLSSSCHCALAYSQIGNTREIEVVYVGVSLDRFDSPGLRENFRDEFGIDDGETAILFMGRFESEMGLDSIFNIASKIIAMNPKVKFIIAGASGALTSQALDLESKYPQHFIVRNNIPFSEQPAYYIGSDIVLAPTVDQHACMGVTIKEAMAASKPVIGSDSGGIPEAIIDHETGIIVPLLDNGKNNEILFHDAILTLANDSILQNKLGKTARWRAEELFSDKVTVQKYQDAFYKTLDD